MWLTFSLPYASNFADVFLCLGLHMLYVNFRKRKTYVSIWHQKCSASHEILDSLKGVVTKNPNKGVVKFHHSFTNQHSNN